MRTFALLLLTASAALSACATEGPPDPALIAAAERPITCTAGPDCEAKWSRAVAWIAQRSHWKIQTQTDQLVTTFGPVSTPVMESVYGAFTVTKAAEPRGLYRIEVEVACANPFGCVPSTLELKAALVRSILGEVQ